MEKVERLEEIDARRRRIVETMREKSEEFKNKQTARRTVSGHCSSTTVSPIGAPLLSDEDFSNLRKVALGVSRLLETVSDEVERDAVILPGLLELLRSLTSPSPSSLSSEVGRMLALVEGERNAALKSLRRALSSAREAEERLCSEVAAKGFAEGAGRAAASDAVLDLKRAAASLAEVNAAGQDERRTLHAEKEELLRIQRGLMLELQTEQDGSDATRDELAAAKLERGRLKVAEVRAGELQALLASQSSELQEARDMANGCNLEVKERDKMYSIRGDELALSQSRILELEIELVQADSRMRRVFEEKMSNMKSSEAEKYGSIFHLCEEEISLLHEELRGKERRTLELQGHLLKAEERIAKLQQEEQA